MVTEWKSRLEKALLKVENDRRAVSNFPRLPPETIVWLPAGPNANLYLLTLKVWCIRYCVTPEFVLEHLTLYYRNLRRYDPKSTEVTLGLPASTLASTTARKHIEEMVIRVYPNGENRKIVSQPPVFIPARNLNYENPDEALRQYAQGIAHARNSFEIRSREQRTRLLSARRPFRKPVE